MAHTKSALKRIRQDKRRNLRNQSVKSTVRTATRAFRETLEEGDAPKTEASLRLASKTLCKAATKGVCASRRPRGGFPGWPKRRTSRWSPRIVSPRSSGVPDLWRGDVGLSPPDVRGGTRHVR